MFSVKPRARCGKGPLQALTTRQCFEKRGFCYLGAFSLDGRKVEAAVEPKLTLPDGRVSHNSQAFGDLFLETL
jgi:hypothetical protein